MEIFDLENIDSLSANSINASGDIPSSRISPVMVAMNGHVLRKSCYAIEREINLKILINF